MSALQNESQFAIKQIIKLLEEKNMNKAEFARQMGVVSSYISNWQRRGIPIERLPRAANILGVSVDQLLNRVNNVPDTGMPMLLTGRIPVVGRAKLGDEDCYFADIYSDPDEDGSLPIPSDDAHAYALRCEGTSMMPRIQSGEFVIAEPSIEAQPGDEVVVQDLDGRCMVKRFLYKRDGNLFLGSINELHSTVIIPLEKVKCIDPVLAIVPKKLWRPS